MATRACFLTAAPFISCLLFVSGTLTDDQNLPRTIDEAIMKANGGGNVMKAKGTRMREDKIMDGMDLLLSRKQYEKLHLGSRERLHDEDDDELIKLWPNGVIPYKITGSFTTPQMTKIDEAMSTWQHLTCINFRPASRHDVNRIEITIENGCWSELGMSKSPEPQKISLAFFGCFFEGTVEHELGHAIGLVHEHQRPERDNYLEVYLDRVIPRRRDQVEAYNEGAVDKMGLDYDYYSIMHYGKKAFSTDGRSPTLVAYDRKNRRYLPEITKDLGRVLGPSFTDVKLVNLMYNCNASCKTMPSCGEDCFVDKHCKCFCKKDMPAAPCVDYEAHCQQRALQGKCSSDQLHMQFFCRKTCQVCAVNGTIPPEKPQFELPCVNRHTSCQAWADSGSCDTNPDYMHVNCRKACRKCKVNDLSGCVDEDFENCRYMKHYCEHFDRIRKKCKRTCGVCT